MKNRVIATLLVGMLLVGCGQAQSTNTGASTEVESEVSSEQAETESVVENESSPEEDKPSIEESEDETAIIDESSEAEIQSDDSNVDENTIAEGSVEEITEQKPEEKPVQKGYSFALKEMKQVVFEFNIPEEYDIIAVKEDTQEPSRFLVTEDDIAYDVSIYYINAISIPNFEEKFNKGEEVTTITTEQGDFTIKWYYDSGKVGLGYTELALMEPEKGGVVVFECITYPIEVSNEYHGYLEKVIPQVCAASEEIEEINFIEAEANKGYASDGYDYQIGFNHSYGINQPDGMTCEEHWVRSNPGISVYPNGNRQAEALVWCVNWRFDLPVYHYLSDSDHFGKSMYGEIKNKEELDPIETPFGTARYFYIQTEWQGNLYDEEIAYLNNNNEGIVFYYGIGEDGYNAAAHVSDGECDKYLEDLIKKME